MIIALSIFSCKNDKPVVLPQPIAPALFYMHLHTMVDTNEANLGDTLMNADGRKMILTVAQLYISGIKFIRTDASVSSFANTYLHKIVDSEEYYIGTIPAGNYNDISFSIGIDSAMNHKIPSGYLASHAPMQFGTTAQGYIFVNVQGFIDTSASKKGSPTCPFSYKIGSDALLKSVKLPVHTIYSATPGGMVISHLMIDYGMIVKGLNLKTENTCATYDNPTLAAKIANNIPLMFKYEY